MKNTKKNGTGRLNLSVQCAVRDGALPNRSEIRKWLKAAYDGAAEVTVRFVDAEEGRSLNKAYRDKDYATNVLSFPYAPPPRLAGDLVLCVPVVLREAEERRRPVGAHFAHLIVHGMLHLQGYDHERDHDAEIMEQKERDILAALGYPDPYGES
jgi:probable rRNA maturation factor